MSLSNVGARPVQRLLAFIPNGWPAEASHLRRADTLRIREDSLDAVSSLRWGVLAERAVGVES